MWKGLSKRLIAWLMGSERHLLNEAEKVKRKDCMGNMRWKTPYNVVERVKQKKDCMGNK